MIFDLIGVGITGSVLRMHDIIAGLIVGAGIVVVGFCPGAVEQGVWRIGIISTADAEYTR